MANQRSDQRYMAVFSTTNDQQIVVQQCCGWLQTTSSCSAAG